MCDKPFVPFKGKGFHRYKVQISSETQLAPYQPFKGRGFHRYKVQISSETQPAPYKGRSKKSVNALRKSK